MDTKTEINFPTTECGRCGGSGHYSFNTIDGSRCYGCNGTGKALLNRKVAEVYEDYRMTIRRGKEAQAQHLNVGDTVVSTLSSRTGGGATWETVASIEDTREPCGWKTEDGVRTVTATRLIVKLENGTEREVAGNQVIRRHFVLSEEQRQDFAARIAAAS